MTNDLEFIKELVNLVVLNKLDQLKVGEISIVKVKHDFQKTDTPPSSNKKTSLSDEELVMFSTSAPTLTPEQVEALSIPSKPLKIKRDK